MLARRRAFTLLELLIVISIIGLLTSLILPAVQASREAARRTHCQSNLRQITLANFEYEEVNKTFPPGSDGRFGGSYGPLPYLLPYLEQANLYDQIDMEAGRLAVRRDVYSAVVRTFLCPNDDAPPLSKFSDYGPVDDVAGTNYAGNAGTWVASHGFDGLFRYNNVRDKGAGPPLTPGNVADGSAHTSAFLEILRADFSWDRLRVAWNLDQQFSAHQLDEFAESCRTLPDHPRALGWFGDPTLAGKSWLSGNVGIGLYNHAVTPNQPCCLNLSGVTDMAATATSHHPEGVNVGFADGHVKFVGDNVHIAIWRGYGSRAGHD